MNARAFVSPPEYWTNGHGKHVVVVETYNWCGHPRFGSTKNEVDFDTEAEAVDYLRHLGYTAPY